MGLYTFQAVMLPHGGPSAREGRALSPLASRGEAQYRAHACHRLRGHGGFLGPDLTDEALASFPAPLSSAWIEEAPAPPGDDPVAERIRALIARRRAAR